MRALIRSIRSCKSVPISGVALFALVLVLGGVTLASNMGFKLNYGTISAMNSLFRPHGYDREGTWTGEGSGVSFSLSLPESGSETALLNLKTPPGTISLPYWYEVRCPRATGRVRNTAPPVGGDPYMRYSGTNFNYNLNEPLTFASSDGVAEISIFSRPDGNPMVRYSGTGNLMQTQAGQVESFIGTDEDWIRIAGKEYIWRPSEEGWTLSNQP